MTELIPRAAGSLAVDPVQHDWTQDQIAALLAMGVDPGATSAELKVFLNQCQVTGLNPFTGQIHMLPRRAKDKNGQWYTRQTIQIGIDGFRVVGNRPDPLDGERKFRGRLGPEWADEYGKWLDYWPGPRPPVAARVGILRADLDEPVWGKAMYLEYVPLNDKGEVVGSMWRKMPAAQLAKCAEAQAWRVAFPHDLAGVYAAEEMDQSGPSLAPFSEAKQDRLQELLSDAEQAGTPDALRAVWRDAGDAFIDEPIVDPQTGEVLVDETTGQVRTLRGIMLQLGAELDSRGTVDADLPEADVVEDDAIEGTPE